MIIHDGQEYTKQSDVPDLGSIRCVSHEEKTRNYILKEVDADKLKLITYVADGSTARVLDGEQDYYTFLCGEWVKE